MDYKYMTVYELSKELVKYNEAEELLSEFGYKRETRDRSYCLEKINEIEKELYRKLSEDYGDING